jgi:hypothetical protein
MKMLYFDWIINVYFFGAVYAYPGQRVTIPSQENYDSLKRFPAGAKHVEWIFPRYFYIILARFSSVKINGAVVCLSFVINMARFGNINDDEFT